MPVARGVPRALLLYIFKWGNNMPERERLERISRTMCLSPYQLYILQINIHKYNLRRLVKCGNALYAPYKCQITCGLVDCMKKIIFGSRGDLIGPDRLLAFNKRGIKISKTYF